MTGEVQKTKMLKTSEPVRPCKCLCKHGSSTEDVNMEIYQQNKSCCVIINTLVFAEIISINLSN